MENNQSERYAEIVSVTPNSDSYFGGITIIKERDPLKGERSITLKRTENDILTNMEIPLELINMEKAGGIHFM